MAERRYSDYIEVKDDYRPNMTRELIDETSDTWLNFFPHKTFVEFLQKLLCSLDSGTRSTWLQGNYGTGKSNAALVVQKLFMDDETRVRRWFNEYSKYFSDATTLQERLFARRSKTLVVYDYNACGLGADQEFLVRLEKGVASALRTCGLKAPAGGNLEATIDRLRREGKNFILARDSMTEELTESFCAYKNVEDIIKALREDASNEEASSEIFAEVRQVFRRDGIFLDVGAAEFRRWIKQILKLNNLENVVYIFDEFTEFVEAHKTQLKTFEEVTEAPNVNRFFLVPITHQDISAFQAENSSGAKRAKDRFNFCKLEMPTEVAFQLAAHAFKEKTELQSEWKDKREQLFSSIIGVVDKCMEWKNEEDKVDKKLFFNLLPIHPLSAFFLKFLSESVRSNQRSLFEYLKGNAEGHEFQDFIATGGPLMASRQFLTVDYLWKYFIERDGEIGLNENITTIKLEFNRLRNVEFANKTDDDVEIRVLKAVFLFILLGRRYEDGHKLLLPTPSNVGLAFQGDGSVVNAEQVVRDLADKKHCFIIAGANKDERIELFASSVGRDELQKKCEGVDQQFHDLLYEKVKSELETYTVPYKPGYAKRFVFRASDCNHMAWGNSISSSNRDKFGVKDASDGTISLWFVFAKDHKEELAIPSKIEAFLNQSKNDFRMLFFAFKERSFCEDDSQLWNKYCKQYAQYDLTNEKGAKGLYQKAYEKITNDWLDKIKDTSTIITVYRYEGEKVVAQELRWHDLYRVLDLYVRQTLPSCVDYLAGKQITAFSEIGPKNWAKAGINFEGTGPQAQLVNNFKSQGIDAEGSTLAPDHPLAKLKAFFEGKFKNSVDRGGDFSLRKTYIELRRAPYGFKPCAVTAFCLGYALKWALTKGYRWTNGQNGGELDVETLAEMIETVVKKDSAEKFTNEKTICRLSKEDKAFLKNAPRIFGVAEECQKVEDATRLIQSRVSLVSEHVPLWILAKHASKDEKHGAQIQEIFETVCKLCQISSKKKNAVEERSECVKKIGELLLNQPELVKAASDYVKSEKFVLAFKEYVDAIEPKLPDLALKVFDVSGQYSDSVLKKISEEGGVLWNERDVSVEIQATLDEYRVIDAAKSLLGFQSFSPYSAVVEQLKNRVKLVKAPISMILATYPNLDGFITCLFPNDEEHRRPADVLASALEGYSDDVRKLFANAGKSATLTILRSRFGDDALSDDELMELASDVSVSLRASENDFINELHKKREEREKKSVVGNLKNEWFRISGTQSPVEWAKKFRIPPRYAFSDVSSGDECTRAVVSPEKYSSDALESILEKFRDTEKIDVDSSQRNFLEKVVPSSYAGLGVTFGALANFLCRKYGDNPCLWSALPNIDEFIREQYLTEFAPKIAQKIADADPEELKEQVLALVKENQNVGMYFWQDK